VEELLLFLPQNPKTMDFGGGRARPERTVWVLGEKERRAISACGFFVQSVGKGAYCIAKKSGGKISLLHFTEKFYILIGREQDFHSPGNRFTYQQEEISWNSFNSSVSVSSQLCKI
jgi:hypothetical protein